MIWWPILYNPIDLWSVIRDMVADLVQSYRSMGCHSDMVADPVQSYRSMVPYVKWSILHNPVDLWGVK